MSIEQKSSMENKNSISDLKEINNKNDPNSNKFIANSTYRETDPQNINRSKNSLQKDISENSKLGPINYQNEKKPKNIIDLSNEHFGHKKMKIDQETKQQSEISHTEGFISKDNSFKQYDHEDFASDHNNLDNKSLEQLKAQYERNKRRFESNMHTMNRDQVLLEHLLLSIEDAMFNRSKQPETLEQALQTTKRRFLNDLECCNQRFSTFNDFIQHMETVHQNEDDLYDFEQDSPYYSHENIKENNYNDNRYKNEYESGYRNEYRNGYKNEYERQYRNDYQYDNQYDHRDDYRNEYVEEYSRSYESDPVNEQESIPTRIENKPEQQEKKNKLKPYKCDVPNCKKAYTSAYGLRYHIENGHVEKDESDKPYACQYKNCSKRYKNTNGLKYHIEHNHADHWIYK